MTAWDVQAGIERKFGLFGLEQLGDTAFWGGYGQVNDGFGMGSNGNGGNLGGVPANGILAPGTFVNINTPVEMTGSDVNRWFLAFDQDFDVRRHASLRGVSALRCRHQFGDAGWQSAARRITI